MELSQPRALTGLVALIGRAIILAASIVLYFGGRQVASASVVGELCVYQMII